MDAIDRIIWSADVANEAALMAALDLMPKLRNVKVDRMFLDGAGFGVIDRLKERGLRVFSDAKIIEIPSKMVGIAKRHLEKKPWMLNCMAGGISSGVVEHDDPEKLDGLKRFADACHKAGTKPCAVTVLTSKTETVVAEEFNGRESIEQVLYYVETLLDCGFTDVVCSPKEIKAIRAVKRFDCLCLNTPGVRPAGVDPGDQARTDTPEETIRAGATRLIIGRPITQGVPADNLRHIVGSISRVRPFIMGRR